MGKGSHGGHSSARSGRGGWGSPHANRSNSMNSNNPAYHTSMQNRSMQMNPNNPRYPKKEGGYSGGMTSLPSLSVEVLVEHCGDRLYIDENPANCVICGEPATVLKTCIRKAYSFQNGVQVPNYRSAYEPFCENHTVMEMEQYEVGVINKQFEEWTRNWDPDRV